MNYNEIYHWFGLVSFWLSVALGAALIAVVLMSSILNVIGRKFDWIWGVVELFYYRSEFKEFMKNKERVKRPSEKSHGKIH